MKTLQLVIIGILIASGAVMIYYTVSFELAEQYFENTRNGLICNKPGSSCPYPDFEDPVLYGLTGIVVFFFGLILTVFKDRSKLTARILGVTAILTGIPALVFGILAYLDDYNHFLLIMKNCSDSPCMYPNVFANIPSILFYGIYGAILIVIGVIFLVRERIRK